MFLLLFFLACDDPTITPTFYAEEISPAVKYQEMETEIQQALMEWENGNGQQAREKMVQIFEGPFQELQPLLIQQDRIGEVHLEVVFGETIQKMKSLRSKGRRVQSEKLIRTLQEVSASIKQLPKAEQGTEEGN